MHDNNLYPDPTVFDPDRHLGETPQTDPLKFVFGFGRRACPGEHLPMSCSITSNTSSSYLGAHFAELSLFLNITNVLAVFNISKELDKDGKEIEPNLDFSTGVTTLVTCDVVQNCTFILPSFPFVQTPPEFRLSYYHSFTGRFGDAELRKKLR